MTGTCSYMKSMFTNADTINSPQWPKVTFPSNRDCHWKITVDDNRGIKIAILDFNLKFDLGCDDNKVKIKGESVTFSVIYMYMYTIMYCIKYRYQCLTIFLIYNYTSHVYTFNNYPLKWR